METIPRDASPVVKNRWSAKRVCCAMNVLSCTTQNTKNKLTVTYNVHAIVCQRIIGKFCELCDSL